VLKGVLHVHSVFSDGEESLEQVVELLKGSGMQFTAVSDHAEVFDEARMTKYVELCAALSDARFLVIPGLEFSLYGGNIHILGYGITQRVRFSTMDQLVDGIHAAGGIAVLAHPPAGSTNLIAPIRRKLDGIEVWNGRYDGVHVPRVSSIQLLRRVRLMNVKASAYCGVDLHKIRQAEKPVAVEVHTDVLDRDEIIGALAEGRFNLRGGRLEMPANGELTFLQEMSIAIKQPFCRPWAG
jgi:hypothetical protein